MVPKCSLSGDVPFCWLILPLLFWDGCLVVHTFAPLSNAEAYAEANAEAHAEANAEADAEANVEADAEAGADADAEADAEADADVDAEADAEANVNVCTLSGGGG